MSGELQHCPECREEYVAGIPACVECGKPLHPGALPRGPAKGAAARATAATAAVAGDLDRLVAELPGMEANQVVQSLLMEEIACRLECQGVIKVYQPGQRPAEPLAVTLPVSIYVSAAQLESAQEIVASLQEEDVIGEQWNAVPVEDDAERDGDLDNPDGDVDEASAAPHGAAIAEAEAEADEAAPLAAPAAESTTMRTVVLLVVVGLVLLLLFAR